MGGHGNRNELIVSTCSDCGDTRYLQNRPENIRRSTCRSCTMSRVHSRTHGMTKTPLYRVWNAMKQRCATVGSQFYARYGGRGITVCQEWIDSFEEFHGWAMANGYTKGLQIDRENNDGNYEPNNCRWVVPVVNARNRAATKLTIADVQEAKYMLSRGHESKEIAELLDVSHSCVWAIKKGHAWGDITVGTWIGATASA